MRFFLGILLIACLASFSNCLSKIHVDPKTHHFVDEEGQVRIFHGVNAVEKVAPYYPIYDKFDPDDSLTPGDAKLLKKWGMNVVRLGTMWPGVMPSKGEIDKEYLDNIAKIVDILAEEGIYVVLDMHQDLWERRFCGEGVPSFVADLCQSSYQSHEEYKPFPSPLNNGSSLPVDEDGNPTMESCLETSFFQYYLTYEVSASFQCLYDNEGGEMWSLMGDFWEAVADRFSSYDSVIGYEFINEPWAGDYFEDPKRLIVPGYAEKNSLQPLYQYLHQRIREVDDDKLVFYEGVTWDIWPIGFTSTPGGEEYDDRQVLSYHIYCPSASDQSIVSKITCSKWNNQFFNQRMSDVDKLGGGMMLTEFGALPSDPSSIYQLDLVVEGAAFNMQSWMYWSYKDFNDLTTINGGHQAIFDKSNGDNLPSQEKVHSLSKPYATSIGGVPVTSSFDTKTSSYSLTFTPFPSSETTVFVGDWMGKDHLTVTSTTSTLSLDCGMLDEGLVDVIVNAEEDEITFTISLCKEGDACSC